MNPRTRRRGQPMVALALLLGSWVGARALLWEPAPMVGVPRPEGFAATLARVAPDPAPNAIEPAPYANDPDGPDRHSIPMAFYHSSPLLAVADTPGASPVRIPDTTAAPALPPVPYVSYESASRSRRWSGDAWMMLRDGSVAAPVSAPARATYGASQLGAVVRYRLLPDSGHRLTTYLRASAALVRPHDNEAAAGLSARPVPGVPLTIAAELRVGDIDSGVRMRPAVIAVTELMPQKLPQGLQAEAYAQAGYVGGKGATAFVDGQLRVDRQVARIGNGELRAGGGAWGGAQEGASRLDIGPAMILGVPINDIASMRLAVDWRFRIAGNAVPDSGPALTLSAGF